MSMRRGLVRLGLAAVWLACAVPVWAGSLSTGTYKLSAYTLKTPWLTEAGSIQATAGPGGGPLELNGYTWAGDMGMMLAGQLVLSGERPRCVLTVDANGNNQVEDDASVAGKVLTSTPSGLRFSFAGVKLGKRTVTLVADVPREGGSGNLYLGVTQVLRAALPMPPGKCMLYVPAAGGRADMGWLDADGDQVAQVGEVVPLGEKMLVGVGDGLRSLKLTPAPAPRTVTVAAPKIVTGKIALKVTDGAGKPLQLRGLVLYGGRGMVTYLRPGAVILAPEGDQSLQYRVALGGGREALFATAEQVKVPKGGTLTLKLGGKVLVQPQITARNGEVSVSTEPRTVNGQKLSGFQGPGESGGVLKVFSSSRELVLRASLEFG